DGPIRADQRPPPAEAKRLAARASPIKLGSPSPSFSLSPQSPSLQLPSAGRNHRLSGGPPALASPPLPGLPFQPAPEADWKPRSPKDSLWEGAAGEGTSVPAGKEKEAGGRSRVGVARS
ncbi:hypothetical protein Taro_000821, partial [Colocasia esculenta]|nr:hypothetical protein [Colocasia esculenta]